MLRLFKQVAPLRFFGGIGLTGGLLSLALGLPVVYEFIQTGLVLRFPTAILASGIMVLSGVSFITGVITESISHGRLEQKRMQYNVLPVPDWITRDDGS